VKYAVTTRRRNQQTIIRANIESPFCLNDDGTTFTSHPWVHDGNMNRPLRKVGHRAREEKGAHSNIELLNLMRNIDDSGFRRNREDNRLHLSNEGVQQTKISQQTNYSHLDHPFRNIDSCNAELIFILLHVALSGYYCLELGFRFTQRSELSMVLRISKIL
jgi:hypothetical protein